MNLKEIEKESKWLKELDADSKEFEIYNNLFNKVRIGTIGIISFISKDELAYCTTRGDLQEDIDSLKIRDRFIAIPFPSDYCMDTEEFMIFIPGQVDGSRGEISNLVVPISHVVEQTIKNDMVYDIKIITQ